MKKSVKIALISLCVIIFVIALSIGLFFLIIEPEFKLFDNVELNLDSLTTYSHEITVLDNDGNRIDDILYDNKKIPIVLDDLQPYTANAFIAIEDKRFYSHGGVDYKRMVSALVSDIKSGSFREGGSTITQQLIKNTHLSNKKTIKRKISEIRLARKLERIWDKNQILESYLNILYFGAGIRGLGTASRVIFDRSANELTLAQSAALASIINNPSKYSPYNNPDNLNKRKELVLKQMLAQQYITQTDYDEAINEQLVFSKNKQCQFISGVIKHACSTLNCTEKQLFLNNLTLETSFDRKMTDAVRNILKEYENEFTVRVLVLDNSSGGIACDETNSSGYINPRRSPASTIKPFLSYAAALEQGLTPLTQIVDEPTSFDGYCPKNYKDVYRGYVSLKQGLIYSSNVVAVKLLKQTGIDRAVATAQSFGLEFAPSDNSLSIALGGMANGVTLLELANAYRTLANGGIFGNVGYLQNINGNHGTINCVQSSSTRVVNDDTAYLLTDMLMECAQTGTAKKLSNSGYIAAKTGTNGDSSGNRDCYCIAFTPKNTIAVWFGANDNMIDNSVTGATCCEIINKLYSMGIIDTTEKFKMPDSVAYYDVDAKALNSEHEVYLANPILPKRYRLRALLSKRNLPIKKQTDIIDFYDRFAWDYE